MWETSADKSTQHSGVSTVAAPFPGGGGGVAHKSEEDVVGG